MKSDNKMGTLAQAVLAAQQRLHGVGKDAKNSHHHYAYVSAEQMIGHARAALHDAGVLVYREGWELAEDGVTVTSSVVVTHASSGEYIRSSFRWPVVCERGRPIDKAVASALTTSLSYYLRDLLLLPREDEASMDRRDDRPERPQPDVGWKRSKADAPARPEAKPAATIADLNAERRVNQQETGTVEKAYTRTAGGVEHRCIDLRKEDGKMRSLLVEETVPDLTELTGRRIDATFFMRGAKLPMLVAFDLIVEDGKEVDDELPMF